MLRLLDEFIYFLEMQETIMNWRREQLVKDCLQVVLKETQRAYFSANLPQILYIEPKLKI